MSETNKIPPFLLSVRCLLTIMAFLGYCLQYMLKINMGMVHFIIIKIKKVSLIYNYLNHI